MNTPRSTPVLSPRKLTRGLSFLTAVALVASAFAQQAAPPSPETAAPRAAVKLPAGAPAESKTSDGETVVLSPFVVNAANDTGYQASSSLAGIGLNTKLTDIGSTVSVITSQFLEDTASNNLRDLLLYQTSAESTGFGGNLSGSDPAPGGVPGEPSLGNGNSGTRVRGLAAADNARNYFKSIIPMDSYNTDRVEINRGANALLFGTGSPAGIINTSTKAANLYKQSGKLELTLGSYGSDRQVFTYNLVPAKGELAIGVAAVRDDTKYQQNFAYSKSDRQYATFTWDPKMFRDKGAFSSTTLSASFEKGKITSNRPRALTPGDRYSSWFDAMLPADLKAAGVVGKVNYDPTGVNAGSFTNFNSFPATAKRATIGVIDNVNRAPVYFFQSVNALTPLDNIQNSPLAGGQVVFGRPMVVDNYRFPAETRIINGVATAIPARTGIGVGAFSRELSRVRSDMGVPDGSFYTSNQMNDPTIFDYFNNTLIGPNSEGISNLQAIDASLQQLMFNRKFGVEVSYNRQNWDESLQSMLPSSTPYISIDVNTRMWTGEVNPNYGRPFTSTPGTASYVEQQLETRRAKAFYELNLQESMKNRLGWILGKHVIAAMKQREIADTDQRGGGSVFYTPDNWAPGSGQSRGSNTGKRVSTWIYLGAPGTSFASASTLSGANLQGLQQNLLNFNDAINGKGVMLTRLRAVTAAQALLPEYAPYVTPVNLLRESREVTNTAGFATLSRNTLNSEAVSLQSNWLGDHVVSTVGWRKEDTSALTALPAFNGSEGYALVDSPQYKIDGRDPALPALVPQKYKDTLFAWSVVAKAPQKWLRRIPVISAFNLYYGASENFQPPTAKVLSAFGDEIPPASGSTKEVGVYVEAFDGVLSARLNFFETSQANVINNAVGNIPAAIMQIDSRAFGMVNDGSLPRGGPAGTPEYYYPKNYIRPPQALLDTFGYQITPNANGLTFNRIATDPGVKDTSDYTTEGMELEVMLKPTRGLSLTFNVAKAESIRTNTGAYARKLLFETPTSTGDPLAKEWLKPWAANVPIAFGSIGNEGTSDQFILNNNFQATVLNPYNTAVLSDGSPATELRKWRANVTARYQVQAGKLKGFEYGGSVRWEDKVAIGFPVVTYDTGVDADGKVTLSPSDGVAEATDVRGYDVKNPFYGPAETRYDLWVAYQTKILRGKVGLRVQLNARNVGVHDELVPIRINPDGTEAAWSIAESERYTLTTRFSF